MLEERKGKADHRVIACNACEDGFERIVEHVFIESEFTLCAEECYWI